MMAAAASCARAAEVAVIGAGMAGLAAAQRFAAHGWRVTIFEKSRGVGGRIATRRDGVAGFDHGAQFVTARGPSFRAYLEQALAAGCASIWRPQGAPVLEEPRAHWYIGAPRMRDLVAELRRPLDEAGGQLILGATALSVAPESRRWRVALAEPISDAPTLFDAVVIAAPAPQAAQIVADDVELVRALSSVEMAPCWALMFKPQRDWDVPELTVDDDAPIALLACDSARPRRVQDGARRYVAHASVEWSRASLELEREAAAQRMIALIDAQFSGTAALGASHAVAHRWRYARVVAPLARPFLCAARPGLALAGDWCLGARVEAAFESGRAAADALIAQI